MTPPGGGRQRPGGAHRQPRRTSGGPRPARSPSEPRRTAGHQAHRRPVGHRPRHRPSAAVRRRRRQLLLGSVVIVLGAALLAGFSLSGTSGPGTVTTLPPTSSSSTTSTVPLPIVVSPVHQVTFTDDCSSCSTENFVTGVSTPGRTLVTDLWYPSRGGAPATNGTAPLIVFASGYALDPTDYLPLVDAWVAAGYVVAAPLFPDTNSAAVAAVLKVYPVPGADGDPHSSPESDVANQPADMAYVISQLVRDDHTPAGGVLGVVDGLFDSAEIGIAGQSDGGDTVAALAYNSCCVADTTIPVRAAIVLSGAESGAFSGSWFASRTPLLVVQGTDDACNSPQNSDLLYDGAPAAMPKAFLLLEGADHLVAYTRPDSYERVVAKVTTDFFDLHLHVGSASAAGLQKAGTSRISSLITTAQAPALSPVPITWTYDPGSTTDPCSINFTGPPGSTSSTGAT